jgi:hypothetical protein
MGNSLIKMGWSHRAEGPRLTIRRSAPLWCRASRGWPHPLFSWLDWSLTVTSGAVQIQAGPFNIWYWR